MLPSTASPPKPPSHRSEEASSPPVPPPASVEDVADPLLADLEDQAVRQQRRRRRPEVQVVGRQGGEVGRREAILDGQARAEAQHAVGVIDLVVRRAVAGGDVEAAVARGFSGRGPDARLALVRRGKGDHRPRAGDGRSHDASLVVGAVPVQAAERHVHPRAEQRQGPALLLGPRIAAADVDRALPRVRPVARSSSHSGAGRSAGR